MDRVEVTTTVYLPPKEVYGFLVDFERYAGYSEHLRTVRGFGDGGPGTEYELVFSWWKLKYTARSEVVETDPPERIEWRLTKDLDAGGRWLIEPRDGGEATTVTFIAEYAPWSAEEGVVDLPWFVSLEWVIDRVRPKIESEAKRVVRRIVADLEGEPREIELEIKTR